MKKEGERNFLVLESKKGLSEIVATLLIILLVIIAIGIIWGVLRNVISSGSEEISFSGLTLDLGITRASVVEGVTTISVRRKTGTGDVAGLRFIFFDGENSQSVDKTTSLLQGEEKTFTITSEEITGVENGWTVSVAPIYLTNSGAEVTGEITHTVTLGNVTPAIIDGGDEGGEGGVGTECTETPECNDGLECIDETCQEVGDEGAECDIDTPCGTGFECLETTCSCKYAQTEGIIDDPAAACTAELFECGTATICGETIDCTVELGGCEFGEYCASNLCIEDTPPLNNGTITGVLEDDVFASPDLPSAGAIQGKYVNFLVTSGCHRIKNNLVTDQGTKIATLQTKATGLSIGETYEVWGNTMCGDPLPT